MDEAAKPWQEHAISWLRLQAAIQACTNANSPEHARAYPNWQNVVKYATRFAEDLQRQYAKETYVDPATAEYESWRLSAAAYNGLVQEKKNV